MTALPIAKPDTPDYLPARMVNEFVYCPRLFFYEWVDGLFLHSQDTVAGALEHKRVDKESQGLPPAEQLAEEGLRTRAITLASDSLRVIAKLDLVDADGGFVTPVDYKHGRPRDGEQGLELWPADRVQVVLQALVLRHNGYAVREAIVYYAATKQKVRIAIDEAAEREATAAVREAYQTAENGILPPPLIDSPKCAGCSLAPICLPDESALLGHLRNEPNQLSLFPEATPERKPAARDEVRRLVTPRDDLRPVYLNTSGLRVGKSGDVLQVKEPAKGKTGKDTVIQEIRLHEICQVNLMGQIQLTTQAIHALAEAEIPICYFSTGGWFYAVTTGMTTKNVFLRQSQYRQAEAAWFALRLARQLVSGKIRNQRVMVMRNHLEPNALAVAQMKRMAEAAEAALNLTELLGIEGQGARLYFSQFNGMLKASGDSDRAASPFSFDFTKRNRRPPRDPVNALLSLAYSLLAKDLTVACYAVGFDPMLGFYHQPRYGRPALALDLMEPFRPLIADTAVLQAINTGMVMARHFVQAGESVALTAEGRKAFYHAYEMRMDSLVTHPLFEYRVSYRRMLEIQARLLAKYLEGSVAEYPVFVTR